MNSINFFHKVKGFTKVLISLFLFLVFSSTIIYSFNIKTREFSSLTFQESAYDWKFIGPDGGSILSMIHNPKNAREIYVLLHATTHSTLYKTENLGRNWERIYIFESHCIDIVSSISNPDIIYSLSSYCLFKSTNKGIDWEVYDFAGFSIRGTSYGRLAVHPYNPDVIYASGVLLRSSKAGYLAVVKSIDGGKNWDIIKIANKKYHCSSCLALDPHDPNILYVGGIQLNSQDKKPARIFKSSDGGSTWMPLTNLEGENLLDITIDPVNTNKVYACTYRNVFRSLDGGITWKKNSGTVFPRTLAVDPLNNNLVYAGGYDGICCVSKDGGDSWIEFTKGLFGVCRKILVLPDRVLYGSSAGIYKSINNGRSWKPFHSGIKANRVRAIAASASFPNRIYASVSSGFYQSRNSGKTWTKLPFFAGSDNIMKIKINPKNRKEIYIVNNKYSYLYRCILQRSLDGGKTWEDIFVGDQYQSIIDFTFGPKNHDHIYLAGWFPEDSKRIMTLHKSTDKGKSWTMFKVGQGYSYAIAISPKNDQIIFIGGRRDSRAVLFRSVDGGLSWKEIGKKTFNKFNTHRLTDIAIDPQSAQKVYIGTFSGFFKSKDSGNTWEKTLPLTVNDVKIDPRSPDKIYIGCSTGIYFSKNRGERWFDLNEGLTIETINCIDLDSSGSFLYAGTEANNIFKLNIGSLIKLTSLK